MRHKMAIAFTIGISIVLVIGIVWWRNISRKYIVEWTSPFHANKLSRADATGNVCIVDSKDQNKISDCAVIPLFPNIYAVLGVDETRVRNWQNENGFDSKGVDRDGQLLAPGYPIFSSLAWSVVEPAYLKGTALSQFLSEINRASSASEDAVARTNLRKLAEVVARAQAESKVLRIG
jgi:hypothetical protein